MPFVGWVTLSRVGGSMSLSRTGILMSVFTGVVAMSSTECIAKRIEMMRVDIEQQSK